MTSYYSLTYLFVFMPILIILYNFFPKNKRWIVLLSASYLFFWAISGKLLVYLILSSVSVHYIGLWLESIQNDCDRKIIDLDKLKKKEIKDLYNKKKKLIVIIAVAFNVGILLILKYSTFFNSNINNLFDLLKIPVKFTVPKFIMPIGISFYTLQAVSYIFDVYRGLIKPDKNLGRLALYMSFFPQIMEGPICRYSDTAFQLWSGKSVTYESLTFGLQRILLGIMKKIVIADRLNPLIIKVFSMEEYYNGGIIAIASIAYTCQLYMEFSGTMDIVIGTSEIFGINVPENFKQPFFSKTISEFWKRWHISLGSWFKDYVFYPIAMSNKSRKLTSISKKRLGNYYGPLIGSSLALFTVWLLNGLWHGVGWNYIFFGIYHFILILSGNIMYPVIEKITNYLNINRNNLLYKIIQILKTSVLVCIGELFFRANGFIAGFSMFTTIIKDFSIKPLIDGTIFKLGIDKYDVFIICFSVVIIFIISYFKEKGVNIRREINNKNIKVRWLVYYSLIIFIIIFGAYGDGYVSVNPIYANF